MPVVPMPDGAIYTPFVFRKSKGSTGGLERIKERNIPAGPLPLAESSVNTGYDATGSVEVTRPTSLTVKPARAARQIAALRSDTTSKQFPVPTAEFVASKVSAHRRQRTNSRPVATNPATRPKPLLAQQRPLRSTRARSAPSKEQPRSRISQPVHAAQKPSRKAPRVDSAAPAVPASPLKLGPPNSRQRREPARTPSFSTATPGPESTNLAANEHLSMHTDPDTILVRLEAFRTNIIAALASSSNAPSALRNWQPPTHRLPFVSRSVDYSEKHGIGYTLADGRRRVEPCR
jgi:hypothetical protein